MGQETSSSTTAPMPAPPQPLPAITAPPVPSHTYLHHTTLAPRPKLILIGDSITEQGSSSAHGWGTSLSIRYSRRMDVANRGMNGYNSRWGMAALPLILEEILGPPASSFAGADDAAGAAGEDCAAAAGEEKGSSATRKKQRTDSANGEADGDGRPNDGGTQAIERQSQKYPQHTFLIGYGANDSCLPDGACSRHHVPPHEYSSILKRMIRMIRTWNAEKNVAVALLTPPPCDTEIMETSRDNENVTRLYAEACTNAAREEGVPVWRGMQLPVGGDDDNEDNISSFASGKRWKEEYLSDGLHLTPMGNYRLYELVVEVLDRSSAAADDDGKDRDWAWGCRPCPDRTRITAWSTGRIRERRSVRMESAPDENAAASVETRICALLSLQKDCARV